MIKKVEVYDLPNAVREVDPVRAAAWALRDLIMRDNGPEVSFSACLKIVSKRDEFKNLLSIWQEEIKSVQRNHNEQEMDRG